MKKIIIILLSVIAYYACDKDEDIYVVKPDVSFSEFTDARDQSVYKCITIGGQVWLAENLRYRLPMGGLDGCYTFYEKNANLERMTVDYPSFQDSVLSALSRGEIVDPEGLRPFQLPSYILPLYFDYYTTTEDYIPAILNRFPDLAELFERMYNNTKPATITLLMEQTDAEIGGYYRDNGFLYTYEAALDAIPEGWRLPTDEDWKKLEETLGMPLDEIDNLDVWRGTEEGRLLKTGEDGCGFNVLLSGARAFGSFPYGTPFINKGSRAYFWSSTKIVENDTTNLGITRVLAVDRNQILRGTSRLTAAYSVRCIKE